MFLGRSATEPGRHRVQGGLAVRRGDDDGGAKLHGRPGEFAAEDAVDDGGHETALWGRGLLAADTLNPLDFDFAGGGVVEVFAVFESGGADGVEEDVLFCVGDLLLGLVVGVV